MDGIDIAGIVLVIALAAGALRQRRIDRHDRQRRQSRTAVKNILRATGEWPS